jgi:hypothetical protein
VAQPEDFGWSSYRARAGFETCEWLDEDPALVDLAATRERRFALYRTLAQLPASEDELSMIRGALQRNQLTGPEEFRDEILRTRGVDVPGRTRGRPKADEGD